MNAIVTLCFNWGGGGGGVGNPLLVNTQPIHNSVHHTENYVINESIWALL